MSELTSLALKVVDGRVLVLDQQRLPDEERWVDGSHPTEMTQHIRDLKVRGAPLIGVAAALSLSWMAQQGTSVETLRFFAGKLRAARPTAVNLMWAIDRLLEVLDRDGIAGLIEESVALFEEDVALSDALAERGAGLIQDGEGILTHCNSGGLATAGPGTALGAILRAWQNGKRLHVWVDETRPLLQGARLTTWELARHGIPHTLITDSMAPLVLRDGRVQRILVGCDRIARNGDFANKVGTYGLAVSAHHHGIPFFPAAPRSTVDLQCPEGANIPIEDRPPGEVRGAAGFFGVFRWAPLNSHVMNPAFDVTPVSLVTALILDNGIWSREDLASRGLTEAMLRDGQGRVDEPLGSPVGQP